MSNDTELHTFAGARWVYAVAADGVSDGGHQLYTLHDEPVPMADRWCLVDPSSTPEQAVGDGVVSVEIVAERIVRKLGFDGLEALPGWNTLWSSGGNNIEECIRNGHLLVDFYQWLGIECDHDGLTKPTIVTPRPAPVGVGDGVVADIIGDVCDMEPDDPDHPDTVCVNVEHLRIVLEHHLATQRPAVATAADDMDEIYAWLRKRDLMQNAAEEGEYQVSDIIAALDDHEAALLLSNPSTPAEVTDEAPLSGHWHHGNGFLCCGTFRIARADWEADVCAAPGMRTEVFDWMCRRLNASPSAGAVVPEGWVLVPVEPSKAIIEAAAKFVHDKGDGGLSAHKFYAGIYRAMLAAAPEVGRD